MNESRAPTGAAPRSTAIDKALSTRRDKIFNQTASRFKTSTSHKSQSDGGGFGVHKTTGAALAFKTIDAPRLLLRQWLFIVRREFNWTSARVLCSGTSHPSSATFCSLARDSCQAESSAFTLMISPLFFNIHALPMFRSVATATS